MIRFSLPSHLQAYLWLAAFAVVGFLLVTLYPDSYQQDGGYHYLFARWAWKYPTMFVLVWARPLFTFLYSFPALLGYPAAKLFSLLICLTTAWQTWRLAQELKMAGAELAIPLLFLQPSYFLLSCETMTEPLLALVFVLALRLHLLGRIRAGMVVASAMILIRPEGFFLGLLWGFWVLLDRRDGRVWFQRLPATLLLASGAVVWWLAALLITGDPLFIKNNWPPDWQMGEAAYGRGAIWDYVTALPEIVGPVLLVPFLIGLILVRRQPGTIVSAFLLLFFLHSVLRAYGLFGAAGYARYFVCVAPAIALITLAGWNLIADGLSWLPRAITVTAAIAVLVSSGLLSLFYVDALAWSRDARAVADMYTSFRAEERPVSRLIWSQAYMCILFDRDMEERPKFSDNREDNLRLLRESPVGTLVFWDGETGPAWYKIKAGDIEAAGYTRLRSRSYILDGLFLKETWFKRGGPRQQEMHLFYKEGPGGIVTPSSSPEVSRKTHNIAAPPKE